MKSSQNVRSLTPLFRALRNFRVCMCLSRMGVGTDGARVKAARKACGKMGKLVEEFHLLFVRELQGGPSSCTLTFVDIKCNIVF